MSNGRPLFAFNEINDLYHFYEAEFAHVCLHEGKAMHEIWLRNHFYFDVCISSFSSHFISLYIIFTLAALYCTINKHTLYSNPNAFIFETETKIQKNF